MKIGSKEFDLSNNVYVMGILNVTPDSFSDGGKWDDTDKVLRHVEQMIKDGAAIIDIGGESTRPGYTRIEEDEEIKRVVPYIEKIKKEFDITVSVDTYKSSVAEEAVKAGANMINDIWGFKGDEGMAKVAAKYGVCCCIMHNRDNIAKPYDNIMTDIVNDIRESVDIGLSSGVDESKLIIDPGIGFGKTYEDNLKVMSNLEKLKAMGYPMLLGTSRKSIIGLTLNLPVEERLEGTIATSVYAVLKGCSIIRVHDVKENYRAIRMTQAMMKG